VDGNTAIVTLNGINVTGDAIGVEEIKERIYWDEDARGLLFDFEGEITFTGNTYRFLQQRFREDYDNPVPLNIVAYNPHSGAFETVVNGLVFTSDCDFNLYEKTVSCQIVDRGFFAKIRNNVNIGFSLGAPDSKLGVDISSLFSITDLRAVLFMNSPTPGVGVTGFRKSMTAFDALSCLVATMSDGEVGFVSNYLTPVVGQETPHILSGRQLRGDIIDIGPVVSWNELFGDLSKLYNLAFAVEEYNVGQWRIRVEPINYFRQSQSIQLFDVEAGVTESIDTSMLYASAIAGSSETREDFEDPTGLAVVYSGGTWNYIPKTPFIFQWQEDYYFQYKSNVDSEWDLRCSVLITHSNIIYYVMSMYFFTVIPNDPNFDDSYDEKAFLVSAFYKDFTGLASTPKLNGIGNPVFFNVFNNTISNYNVMVANAEGIPANAASQFASFGQQYFDAYFVPTIILWGGFRRWNVPNSAGFGQLKNMYLIYDYNSMFPIGEWASNLTLAGSVFGDLRTPENIDYIAITSYFPDVTVNGTDPSTGYVTANSTWVCQVPALYTFKIKGSIYIDWDFVPGLIFNPAKITTFYFVVAQWDSTLAGKKTVKKTTVEFNFDPSSPLAYRNFEITFGSFNADAGDIFQVQFHQTNEFTTSTTKIYLSDDTSWSIAGNSLEGEGGTILTAEKGTSFMLTNQLKANINADLWKDIKANPYKLLNYQVTDDGEARSMNLYDFSRNIISGVTEGETRGRLAAPEQPDVDPGNPVTPEPEEETE
jgi:hypothetical protein